jgi:hypothetical protein
MARMLLKNERGLFTDATHAVLSSRDVQRRG